MPESKIKRIIKMISTNVEKLLLIISTLVIIVYFFVDVIFAKEDDIIKKLRDNSNKLDTELQKNHSESHPQPKKSISADALNSWNTPVINFDAPKWEKVYSKRIKIEYYEPGKEIVKDWRLPEVKGINYIVQLDSVDFMITLATVAPEERKDPDRPYITYRNEEVEIAKFQLGRSDDKKSWKTVYELVPQYEEKKDDKGNVIERNLKQREINLSDTDKELKPKTKYLYRVKMIAEEKKEGIQKVKEWVSGVIEAKTKDIWYLELLGVQYRKPTDEELARRPDLDGDVKYDYVYVRVNKFEITRGAWYRQSFNHLPNDEPEFIGTKKAVSHNGVPVITEDFAGEELTKDFKLTGRSLKINFNSKYKLVKFGKEKVNVIYLDHDHTKEPVQIVQTTAQVDSWFINYIDDEKNPQTLYQFEPNKVDDRTKDCLKCRKPDEKKDGKEEKKEEKK